MYVCVCAFVFESCLLYFEWWNDGHSISFSDCSYSIKLCCYATARANTTEPLIFLLLLLSNTYTSHIYLHTLLCIGNWWRIHATCKWTISLVVVHAKLLETTIQLLISNLAIIQRKSHRTWPFHMHTLNIHIYNVLE